MYFMQLGVWILVVFLVGKFYIKIFLFHFFFIALIYFNNFNNFFQSKCLLLIFQKVYSQLLQDIGNKLMSPFTNGKLKLIMVMIIIPFICNAIQFWIIDNILKFTPSNTEELELLKEGEVYLGKNNKEEIENEYKLPEDRNEQDFVVINFDKP